MGLLCLSPDTMQDLDTDIAFLEGNTSRNMYSTFQQFFLFTVEAQVNFSCPKILMIIGNFLKK